MTTEKSKNKHSIKSQSDLKQYLVVWDFDWSLINENSDEYPFKIVCGDKYEEENEKWLSQREDRSFIQYMDQIKWPYLFDTKKTSKKQFIDILSNIPVFEENLHIVRSLAKNPNVTQYIISNANTILTDTILKAYNLTDIFNESNVYTNFGHWDDNDRLRVKSYCNVRGPHSCESICTTPDLCKGQVLLNLPVNFERFEKMVFVGDGGNDLCPISKFSTNGYGFVRTGKNLETQVDLIASGKHPHITKLQARVCKWSNGKELLQNFRKVLNTVKF